MFRGETGTEVNTVMQVKSKPSLSKCQTALCALSERRGLAASRPDSGRDVSGPSVPGLPIEMKIFVPFLVH